MKLKDSLLFVTTLLLLLAAGCSKEAERPNIVFIFPDQLRRSALGFMEQENVFTPNIDGLAEEGLVLTGAVSTVPVCSPFRGMLMTGKYYYNNNLPQNCNSNNRGVFLRTDDYTILDALSDAGYDVGYIGKWHLEEPFEPFVESGNNGGTGKNNWEEWTPPERRHGVKFWYAYNTFDNHFKPHYWTNDSKREERIEIDEWSPIHETDVAIDFIENREGSYRDSRKPFAVFLSYNPPHTPYNLVPEKYRRIYDTLAPEELTALGSFLPGSSGERYGREVMADYYACISGVDEQVGRLIAYLEEKGLRDNTIVVFTSDHGNCTGAHNHITKTIFFEESFGIPLVISWPQKITPRMTDDLFAPPDFFPTLVAMAGIEVPEVEGKDLSGTILGEDSYRHKGVLYANMNLFNADSIVEGYPGKAWGERGYRTKQYMLVVNKLPGEPTGYLLFDLVGDPFQLENIAADRSDLVERLLEGGLVPLLKEIGDEWYKIPETKDSHFPGNLRALEDNDPMWSFR